MVTKPLQFHAEQGLGVLQFWTSDQDTFHCVPLDKAIREKQVEVREVSESGSVNSLFVINLSQEYVFLFDGDILTGAKQNRVINTSILLSPESKTKIPVSCVEQGRWSYRSSTFSSTNYAAPPILRAGKARQVANNLKLNRGFVANQADVWEEVSGYQERLNVASATSNLSDVYDRRLKQIEEMIQRFALDKNANGMAIFFGGELASIDLFNSRQVYEHYYPRILHGAAFEDRRPDEGALSEAEARFRTLDLLDKLDGAEFEEYDGIGTGTNRRCDLDSAHISQLLFSNHMVHTGIFSGSQKPIT